MSARVAQGPRGRRGKQILQQVSERVTENELTTRQRQEGGSAVERTAYFITLAARERIAFYFRSSL